MKKLSIRLLGVLGALFGTTLASCDKGGLYPILEKRDPAASVDCTSMGATSTWLRSTSVGTEVLLVAAPDPTAPIPAGTRLCFAHGLVEHDSSTRYSYGSVTIGSSGKGQAAFEASYTFDYVASGAILSRKGAQRALHSPPLEVPVSITKTTAGITATIDGTTGHYVNVYDVVLNVDTTTQDGAEDAFRLLNLPLFTSQVRLLGFGGGGMTQYISAPGRFVGLARAPTDELPNVFTVSVQSYTTPNTDIRYTQFEDFTGVIVDGLQETDVSISGNGNMHGVLTWSMRDGADGDTDVALEGTVDYDDLQIGNGVASGGSYGFAFTSPSAVSYTIPYTIATDVDLRGLLPEDAP